MARREPGREGPFPDSQQVYHQLRWDPRFSPDACEIVLTDRDDASGTKTIPFREFIPGGAIPWHRVIAFRYGGATLWDRHARIDRRHELAASAAPAAASVERLDATPLTAARFADGAWREERASSSQAWPARLVTWNVLFDTYDAELLDSERRWARLLGLLRETDADVIALTEVTPRFRELALGEAWVRAGYAVSAADASSVTPHGPLLLSRAPLTSLEVVELDPRRRALFATVGTARIAVVHLKSDRRAPSSAERQRDLARVLAHLGQGSGPTFIVGDFNAPEGELEPQLGAAGAVDAWRALHPGEDGFTYDPKRNGLAALLTASGRSARLDRIVLLPAAPGNGARFTSARLLGEAPVEGSHVSDHFGLVAEVEPEPVDLPGAKTVHRSALVLLAPRETWGPIQRLRARHDAERIERWMPHLTLLYGFLDAPLLPAAARALRELAPTLEPVEVVLDRVITFEHRGSATIALGASAASSAALERLQRALVERFPQCTEQNRGPGGTFTPHLTLGRGTREDAAAVRRELATVLPLTWRADALAVLHRPEDVFLVRETIALGVRADDGRPLPATTGSESTRSGGVRGRPSDWQGRSTFGANGTGSGTLDCPSPRAFGPTLSPSLRGEGSALLEACVGATGVRAIIEPFGTSRYAPGFESDELDAVVLIDGSPEGFVAALEHELSARGATHRRVTPTFVRASVGRERLDVHVVVTPRLEPVGAWVEHVHGEAQRTLLGPRDAQRLRALLERHGRAEAFDALFPRVRAWSKARGLEGNAFGYFGGIGWAVLTAAPLLHDARCCRDGSWEAWREWAMQLAPDALVSLDLSAALVGDGLRVATPARPWRDVARAMTRSTRAVLARELREGRDGDVLDEPGPRLVFEGRDDEALGRYQQRFLSMLPELEARASARVVGRVERSGDGAAWRHVVLCSQPIPLEAARASLERLSLTADVTVTTSGSVR